MSFVAIMVYVDAEDPSRDWIEFAADVAQRFNATLIGVSSLLLPAPITVGDVAVTATSAAKCEKHLSLAGDLFRSVGSRQKLKVEWRAFVDPPASVLAREARAADLVIIQSNPHDGSNYSSPDPGDAIMRLGRPALLVPRGTFSVRAERVVIGWKDAREARRAVQDALPFLHEATSATVIEVCETHEQHEAQSRVDDVVRFLTRHRIKARGETVHPTTGSGADQLIDAAKRIGADLLVAGAYGSSRLGEWILGGMTRDLIKRSPVCCLMSH